MKILLTGMSGFVGTNLTKFLCENHEIIGADSRTPRENFEGTTVVIGNLRNKDFIKSLFNKFKFDVVLHFAAQARVDPSYIDPIGTYRDNIEVTLNILDYARQNKVRMIYASSEIIYGVSDRYPCKEHFTLRPDSPYAASKAATDLMVQQARGANTVVVRSGMGFGERSPPSQVICKMIMNCLQDKPLLFPEGPVIHPTRDVNYIGNFARGIEQLVEKPDVTGVFNMGSGREIDVLTIAEKIIAAVGKGRIEFTDKFSYREGEEGKRTWMDNSAAYKAFGYNPDITFEQGLKRTVEWHYGGGAYVYGW